MNLSASRFSCAARFATVLAVAAGCGGSSTPGPESLLPPDYLTTYTQVRPCRLSGDHDLNYTKVYTDATGSAAYLGRMSDFPVDSIVVKEEYDNADDTCTGPVIQWTLMQRLATGSAPTTDDWTWQKVVVNGPVTENTMNCISCHKLCGVPPDGYQGTCSVP